jgi:ABC-type multidrug transport system fused ATPase/permease subunit
MFAGKIAKTVELLILGIFFGFVPVAAIFIATVLFTTIVSGKEVLGPWILWSLLPGLFTDILFLKGWVRNAYTMSAKAIGAVYVFYSVCAIGFFMGIPIGNIFLGILAGIYAARKMHIIKADKERRNQYFRTTAKFAAAVMVLICCLITLWAIAGKMIGYRFETPFLSFTFTIPIFFAIVLAGGAFLVLLQYSLTRISAKCIYKRLSHDTL